MKIPFDIKFRPQIERGEYKVGTEDGFPARIICWDSPIDKERPIIAIVFDDQIEQYKADGRYDNDFGTSNYDLFIITPEPELTEFEEKVKEIIGYYPNATNENKGSLLCEVQKSAAVLLELAKKELCKGCAANMEGYIKGRQDALKEMEKNRVYKHEGPTVPIPVPAPAFWLPCHYGGECTNPFHDCINCHRQSTDGISTTTGTSTAKVEGHE